MAKAYFTIKDIPARGADEGPATNQQLAQLRSLAPFKEADLAGLGQWQASYLIDQAEEIRSQIGSGPPSAKGGSLTRVLLILLIVAASAGAVWRWMESTAAAKRLAGSVPPDAHATPPAPGGQTDPFAQLHGDGTKNPTPAQGSAAAKPSQAPDGTLTSLDGVALPIYVITTARFDLLNEVGKETPIPPGSTIHIEKRGAKGSLTMHIKGSMFVGNEMRVLGKVKLR